jgi:hypothetical protein
MKTDHCPLRLTALFALILLPLIGGCRTGAEKPVAPAESSGVVTYEGFGAVGDGVADDLPAIVAAHAFANEHNLPVRSNPEATYHLGTRALTAIIQTNTDWNTSRFIIDDSAGVQDSARPLFEITSALQPLALEIDSLKRDQARLDVRPEVDSVVMVENQDKRLFIRRGRNQNSGSPQREVFILRTDGTIEGAIEWDYDQITKVEAWPIDPEPLIVSGGHFTLIANRVDNRGTNPAYWWRNILINRSNTVIDGITRKVTGETEIGAPYTGFLKPDSCANITLRNCRIDPHKVYWVIGSAGEPVPKGTYGYTANYVVNLTMQACTMEDIHDESRWGIMGTNHMKNFLIEDCVLSRVDVHKGVSGSFIIRRSELGWQGIKAIGRGELIIEDTTVYSGSFVEFRPDYGSTWDGTVVIRNSKWVPIPRESDANTVFNIRNDGTHDFGYTCSMPRVITIDGLHIDDSHLDGDIKELAFFRDPGGLNAATQPFPYQFTERMEVRNLTIASGRPVHISSNPELADAISLVEAAE